MEKIVLLCDYGLDDACATLFVLDNRGQTPVDIIAIAGNSSVTTSLNNALKLLSNYDGSLEGVRVVETLNKTQNFCKLPSIHGEDGMGDFLEKKPLNIPLLTFDKWMEESGSFTLVSLGPLTLTEEIIKAKEVDGLLIMAGNVAEVPNFNGYEFNHYLDRPAFSYCVEHFPTAKVATLDTCRTPSFNFAKKVFSGDKLIDRTLERCRKYATIRHQDNCYVYDYIAVQYLFYPEKFTASEVVDPGGNRFVQLRYLEGK